MEKGTQTNDPIKDIEKQLEEQKKVLLNITLNINNIVKQDEEKNEYRADLSNQMVLVSATMQELERTIKRIEIEQNILKNKIKREEPKKKVL